LIKKTPIEFFPGHYECIDPRNGTTLFSVAPGSVYREQIFIDDKLKIIVAKGDFGDSRRGGHCQVWDVENCKNLLDDKSCGPTRTTISGSLLVYSDFKSTSCYDYVSRKMLWTLKGDGAPLCEPIVDDKHEFFYILDEDSTWLPGEYSAKRVTGPNYVRLYKFNLKTGKKVWETKIFSIPKEQGTFYDYEVRDLGIEYGLIYNEVSIDKGKIEIKLNRNKFKFTLRASDGKPWK
jgi:outer membrane protein assembly factor BamB